MPLRAGRLLTILPCLPRATLSNYDYIIDLELFLDGSIRPSVTMASLRWQVACLIGGCV